MCIFWCIKQYFLAFYSYTHKNLPMMYSWIHAHWNVLDGIVSQIWPKMPRVQLWRWTPTSNFLKIGLVWIQNKITDNLMRKHLKVGVGVQGHKNRLTSAFACPRLFNPRPCLYRCMHICTQWETWISQRVNHMRLILSLRSLNFVKQGKKQNHYWTF